MAKISPFANLIGLGDKAEDTRIEPTAGKPRGAKPEKKDGESDEDYQERVKKWEESGDEESAETPKDVTDNDEEKCKKAETTGFANGLKAANDRWTTVLASKEAVGKVVMACDMLADTDLDATAIIKALGKFPAPTARSTLHERQAGNPTPAPSTEGGVDPTKDNTPSGFAARMQMAVDQVKGKKPATSAAA